MCDRQRNDNLQIYGNSVQQSSKAKRGPPSRTKRCREESNPFLIKASNNGIKASLMRYKLRIENKMYSEEDLEKYAHK